MDDKIIPNKWYTMKDTLGFHRVKVFEGLTIAKNIIKERIKARWKKGKPGEDTWYLICSPEGGGKSTLTLWFIELYDEVMKELHPKEYKDTPIDNVTTSIKEFEHRMHETERESIITMDEASELSSDRMTGSEAKNFKAKLTVIRFRLFFGLICFVNPLRVGTYFREDRIRGVWIIVRPGVAYYYANSPNNPHFTSILERWEKDNRTKSIKRFTAYAPDFIMHYPDYEGKLWKPYMEKKEKNAQKEISKGMEIDETIGYLLIKDAAIRAHANPHTILAWIRKGELQTRKIGIKTYIDRKELDSLIEAKNKPYYEKKDKINDNKVNDAFTNDGTKNLG